MNELEEKRKMLETVQEVRLRLGNDLKDAYIFKAKMESRCLNLIEDIENEIKEHDKWIDKLKMELQI